MIQVALLLLLAAGGCSHYQENPKEDQIGSTFFYDHQKDLEQIYPLPALASGIEVDNCLVNDQWQQGSCHFQLFGAQWYYYHQQWISGDRISDHLMLDESCELAQDAARWWRAWSDQKKTYWNRSMLALVHDAQDPSKALYGPCFSAVHYAYNKRKTSVSNLSLEEETTLQQWEKYHHWLAQLPSNEVFQQVTEFPAAQPATQAKYENVEPFERLMILYDTQLPESFMTQIFQDFQKQDRLKELYLLSQEYDYALIEEILKKPGKIFLIGYQLKNTLPKEWLNQAHASLTIGGPFNPQRSQDYAFAPHQNQFLSQLEHAQYLLRPQLIIYDKEHSHLLNHPLVQSVPIKLEISTQDYQEALIKLLALPQRQRFFHAHLKDALYLNQPRQLPYNVLLLLEPSLLRLSYPFLRYWHQQRPLFIAPPESLTGVPTLDSSLKGLLLPVPPHSRVARHMTARDEAQDLLELVNRWPWFQYYQGYLYEGRLGRYRLEKQNLACQWDIIPYEGESA